MYLRFMLAGAAIAAAFSVAPALAEDLVFTVQNQSAGEIKELHVSTLDSNSWEENLLDHGPLPSGQTATVTLTNTNGICEFDMRLVYDDDSITDERKMNLCDLDNDTYIVKD
jgi:hypothetical protein